jgi:hypothetical protein
MPDTENKRVAEFSGSTICSVSIVHFYILQLTINIDDASTSNDSNDYI